MPRGTRVESNWPLQLRHYIERQRQLSRSEASGVGGGLGGTNHVVVLGQVSEYLKQMYFDRDPDADQDPVVELGMRTWMLRGLPVNGSQGSFEPEAGTRAFRAVHALGSSKGTVDPRSEVIRILAGMLDDASREANKLRERAATGHAEAERANADRDQATERVDELTASLSKSEGETAHLTARVKELEDSNKFLRGRVEATAGSFPTKEQCESVGKRDPRRLPLGDNIYLESRAGVLRYTWRTEGDKFVAYRSPAEGVPIEAAARARESWLRRQQEQKELTNA